MFWISVKSGFRQVYVQIAAFAVLSILDFVINLQAPVDWKWAWIFTAVVMIVKMFEKAIRGWIAGWSGGK